MMNDRTRENRRAAYESPVLTRIGAFEEITQGNLPGTKLDHPFPTGTPSSQLTFS
jgi:hypothetical protein